MRSGRRTLVMNGEVYDFRAEREILAARGVTFRGGSDAEVLLEMLEAYGVEEALRRARGMFAFATWDGERLTVARDRLGQKPLYVELTPPCSNASTCISRPDC